jgi:hypothetical protein
MAGARSDMRANARPVCQQFSPIWQKTLKKETPYSEEETK